MSSCSRRYRALQAFQVLSRKSFQLGLMPKGLQRSASTATLAPSEHNGGSSCQRALTLLPPARASVAAEALTSPLCRLRSYRRTADSPRSARRRKQRNRT